MKKETKEVSVKKVEAGIYLIDGAVDFFTVEKVGHRKWRATSKYGLVIGRFSTLKDAVSDLIPNLY